MSNQTVMFEYEAASVSIPVDASVDQRISAVWELSRGAFAEAAAIDHDAEAEAVAEFAELILTVLDPNGENQ